MIITCPACATQFRVPDGALGADGRKLTSAWTRKGSGRLYRYYMHTRENKEYAGASGLPRLPAIELEGNVIDQVRQILRAPDLKTRVVKAMHSLDPSIDEALVCVAMVQIDKIWDQLLPAEQERIVRLLIKKVIVTPHTIEVQFRPNGIEILATEMLVKERKALAQEVAA